MMGTGRGVLHVHFLSNGDTLMMENECQVSHEHYRYQPLDHTSNDLFCCRPTLHAASKYYKDGQFSFAAECFERAPEEERGHNNNNNNNSGGLLRLLATEADLALCRARAELTNSSSEATQALLRRALEKQVAYRRALKDEIVSFLRQRQLQERVLSTFYTHPSPNNELLLQFVSSMLMASVSECWIQVRLHNIAMARDVLWNAIKFTASFVAAFNNGLHKSIGSVVNQTLEESLYVLKNTCSKAERARLAFSTMQHTLRSLRLVEYVAYERGTTAITKDKIVSSFLIHEDSSNEETGLNSSKFPCTSSSSSDLDASRKRKRQEDEEDRDGDQDPHLLSQHFLLNALCIHAGGHPDPKQKGKVGNDNERRLEPTIHLNLDQSLMYNPSNSLSMKLKLYFTGIQIIHSLPEHSTKDVAFLQNRARNSPVSSHLLGCYHSKLGNYAKALHSFQKVLDTDENMGNAASTTIEIDGCYRATITNMALCFSYLGAAKPATELLLYLLAMKRTSTKSIQDEEQDTTFDGSTTLSLDVHGLHLSPSVHMASSLSNARWGDQDERCTLLWRLFHAASYANDFTTCVSATKELCDNTPSTDILHWKATCAYLFSLLQCHRPSLVRKSCCEGGLFSSNVEGSPAITICYRLYEADALIQSEAGFHNASVLLFGNVEDADTGQQSKGEEAVSRLTQLAVDEFCSVISVDPESIPFPNVKIPCKFLIVRARNILRCITFNNHGVALVFSGQEHDALKSFQEAVTCATHETQADVENNGNEKKVSADTKNAAFLTCYFNLALLLWREGHLEEAVKTWLTARGIGLAWEGVAMGRVELLKDALQQAISRYGLLAAKEPAERVGNPHIREWKDEKRARMGFINELQVATLDITTLKHAIFVGSKIAAVKYQKSTGGLLGKYRATNS